MKKYLSRFSGILVLAAAVVMLCGFACTYAYAGGIEWKTTDIQPGACDNTDISLRNFSSLTRTQDGYMRVYYYESNVFIEYYDDNFNIVRKGSMPIELEYWGGFYAGADGYYYVITGTSNTDESYSAEVIRVTKYDSNWNRIGAASITGNQDLFGGEVRFPFDYGCVQATEVDGYLYIVTGHEGYVDPQYNQGHQGFLMIKVDESSMTGSIVKSDLWHSFAQYIDKIDNYLYILEQSEGSRYTKLSKYDTSTGKMTDSIPVLEYGGDRTSAWAIACYASVDGMAISSDNVLCIGTSIDQSQYENITSKTAHNIYLTLTPVDDFTQDATSVKWLTNYSGNGESFVGLNLTKINDNKFMVSWEMFRSSSEDDNSARLKDRNDTLSGNELHYMFVDGNGDALTPEYIVAATISDCEPIVTGNEAVFYSSDAMSVDFYSVNTNSSEVSKKVYRVAGDAITWNLDNGILTLSGKGDISFGKIVDMRYPLSSAATSYWYSSRGVWSKLSDNINTIIIEQGITSIPESAFSGLGALKTVRIADGLASIGKEAFAYCEKLETITIPASVTSIGEDMLWTGWYWQDENHTHVMQGAIITPCNSYAMEYAKKYNIGTEDTHKWGEWQPVTGNPKLKQRTCSVCGEVETDDNYTAEDEGDGYYFDDGYYYYDDGRKVTKVEKTKNPAEASEIMDLPAVKISKPKAGKKAVTVKWKKIKKKDKKYKNVQGIEIQYSLDGFKTIAGTKYAKRTKSSLKIKGLKAKTKYWVRIRAYKNAADGKHVSAWKTKTVKVK